MDKQPTHAAAQTVSTGDGRLDIRLDAARAALQAILDTPAPNGYTLGQCAHIGNKAVFALQVLNDDTDFQNQTITISTHAHKAEA